MKLLKNQSVKILFRNGFNAEGLVEKWDNEFILKSYDGNSLLVIQNPLQDIMAIKILLNKVEDKYIEEKNKERTTNKVENKEIEEEHEDLKNLNQDLRAKKLAELYIESIKQDRKIIAEKLKSHIPSAAIDFTSSKYKNIFCK